MKLEDIKPPKGFVIRGYESPKTGDYILYPDNTFDIADTEELGYQSFCIVLDKVWEPQIGALYEFSDDNLSFPYKVDEYGIFTGYSQNTESKFKYMDEKGTAWANIRPIRVPIGK